MEKQITSISVLGKAPSKRYDLTTNTGNFFAGNTLIHNCSASYFLTKHKGFLGKLAYTFGVCSRNIFLKTKHPCSWWNIADALDIKTKLQKFVSDNGHDICIQGEIIGPNIQGNKYGVTDLQFYVFNVFNIQTQQYFCLEEMQNFCDQYGFTMVPLMCRDSILPDTVDEVIDMSKGKSVLKPNVHREGVVWRTQTIECNGAPHSFKCINPDFLLKYQDEDEERQLSFK